MLLCLFPVKTGSVSSTLFASSDSLERGVSSSSHERITASESVRTTISVLNHRSSGIIAALFAINRESGSNGTFAVGDFASGFPADRDMGAAWRC